MKRVLALLAALLALGGCSAVTGEERAFAVALGIDGTGGDWQVSARLPTYQAEGGYMTLTARGTSLGQAMAQLNAAAPMELHYGQLRLLLFSHRLAQSAAFPEVLRALSARAEVRPQAALAVTAEDVAAVMDALEPATGSRLSKSLETLLEARRRLGVLPLTTMAGWQRMGIRQQAVLANVSLPQGESDTGEKVSFSGGWLFGPSGQAQGRLTGAEMQLLSLLMGASRQGTLSLPEGTATLLDTASRMTLANGEVHCRVELRYAASSLTEDGLANALTASLHTLAGKLAAANCDALGITRQAMMGTMTMPQWQAKAWNYPALTWRFTVVARRGG